MWKFVLCLLFAVVLADKVLPGSFCSIRGFGTATTALGPLEVEMIRMNNFVQYKLLLNQGGQVLPVGLILSRPDLKNEFGHEGFTFYYVDLSFLNMGIFTDSDDAFNLEHYMFDDSSAYLHISGKREMYFREDGNLKKEVMKLPFSSFDTLVIQYDRIESYEIGQSDFKTDLSDVFNVDLPEYANLETLCPASRGILFPSFDSCEFSIEITGDSYGYLMLFSGCEGKARVTANDGSVTVVNCDDERFQNCLAIEHFTFPDGDSEKGCSKDEYSLYAFLASYGFTGFEYHKTESIVCGEGTCTKYINNVNGKSVVTNSEEQFVVLASGATVEYKPYTYDPDDFKAEECPLISDFICSATAEGTVVIDGDKSNSYDVTMTRVGGYALYEFANGNGENVGNVLIRPDQKAVYFALPGKSCTDNIFADAPSLDNYKFLSSKGDEYVFEFNDMFKLFIKGKLLLGEEISFNSGEGVHTLEITYDPNTVNMLYDLKESNHFILNSCEGAETDASDAITAAQCDALADVKIPKSFCSIKATGYVLGQESSIVGMIRMGDYVQFEVSNEQNGLLYNAIYRPDLGKFLTFSSDGAAVEEKQYRLEDFEYFGEENLLNVDCRVFIHKSKTYAMFFSIGDNKLVAEGLSIGGSPATFFYTTLEEYSTMKEGDFKSGVNDEQSPAYEFNADLPENDKPDTLCSASSTTDIPGYMCSVSAEGIAIMDNYEDTPFNVTMTRVGDNALYEMSDAEGNSVGEILVRPDKDATFIALTVSRFNIDTCFSLPAISLSSYKFKETTGDNDVFEFVIEEPRQFVWIYFNHKTQRIVKELFVFDTPRQGIHGLEFRYKRLDKSYFLEDNAHFVLERDEAECVAAKDKPSVVTSSAVCGIKSTPTIPKDFCSIKGNVEFYITTDNGRNYETIGQGSVIRMGDYVQYKMFNTNGDVVAFMLDRPDLGKSLTLSSNGVAVEEEEYRLEDYVFDDHILPEMFGVRCKLFVHKSNDRALYFSIGNNKLVGEGILFQSTFTILKYTTLEEYSTIEVGDFKSGVNDEQSPAYEFNADLPKDDKPGTLCSAFSTTQDIPEYMCSVSAEGTAIMDNNEDNPLSVTMTRVGDNALYEMNDAEGNSVGGILVRPDRDTTFMVMIIPAYNIDTCFSLPAISLSSYKFKETKDDYDVFAFGDEETKTFAEIYFNHKTQRIVKEVFAFEFFSAQHTLEFRYKRLNKSYFLESDDHFVLERSETVCVAAKDIPYLATSYGECYIERTPTIPEDFCSIKATGIARVGKETFKCDMIRVGDYVQYKVFGANGDVVAFMLDRPDLGKTLISSSNVAVEEEEYRLEDYKYVYDSSQFGIQCRVFAHKSEKRAMFFSVGDNKLMGEGLVIGDTEFFFAYSEQEKYSTIEEGDFKSSVSDEFNVDLPEDDEPSALCPVSEIVKPIFPDCKFSLTKGSFSVSILNEGVPYVKVKSGGFDVCTMRCDQKTDDECLVVYNLDACSEEYESFEHFVGSQGFTGFNYVSDVEFDCGNDKCKRYTAKDGSFVETDSQGRFITLADGSEITYDLNPSFTADIFAVDRCNEGGHLEAPEDTCSPPTPPGPTVRIPEYMCSVSATGTVAMDDNVLDGITGTMTRVGDFAHYELKQNEAVVGEILLRPDQGSIYYYMPGDSCFSVVGVIASLEKYKYEGSDENDVAFVFKHSGLDLARLFLDKEDYALVKESFYIMTSTGPHVLDFIYNTEGLNKKYELEKGDHFVMKGKGENCAAAEVDPEYAKTSVQCNEPTIPDYMCSVKAVSLDMTVFGNGMLSFPLNATMTRVDNYALYRLTTGDDDEYVGGVLVRPDGDACDTCGSTYYDVMLDYDDEDLHVDQCMPVDVLLSLTNYEFVETKDGYDKFELEGAEIYFDHYTRDLVKESFPVSLPYKGMSLSCTLVLEYTSLDKEFILQDENHFFLREVCQGADEPPKVVTRQECHAKPEPQPEKPQPQPQSPEENKEDIISSASFSMPSVLLLVVAILFFLF